MFAFGYYLSRYIDWNQAKAERITTAQLVCGIIIVFLGFFVTGIFTPFSVFLLYLLVVCTPAQYFFNKALKVKIQRHNDQHDQWKRVNRLQKLINRKRR